MHRGRMCCEGIRETRMGRLDRTMGSDGGFTLLELLITILIIGVLLAIAIATYAGATNSANAAACRQNREAFDRAAVIAIGAGSTEQITELEDLRPFVANYDRSKVCPLDGSPLQFDAVHKQVVCPNHS